MNPLDIPVFAMQISIREMAALTAAVKLVLSVIDRDAVAVVLGDQTDDAMAALVAIDVKLERMLAARKSGRK